MPPHDARLDALALIGLRCAASFFAMPVCPSPPSPAAHLPLLPDCTRRHCIAPVPCAASRQQAIINNDNLALWLTSKGAIFRLDHGRTAARHSPYRRGAPLAVVDAHDRFALYRHYLYTHTPYEVR